MSRYGRKITAFVLALLTMTCPVAGVEPELDTLIQGSAVYLRQVTPTPALGTAGGEWTMLALARSGQLDMEEPYVQDYLIRLEETIAEQRGVLHRRKYTEYSRVVLALTALGVDPAQFGGYDLLAPLADYQQVVWQGTNGSAWALLALDSGDYAMPAAPAGAEQATRQMYVEELLARQLSGGGWNLTVEGQGDPDVTGMVLQALAPYREQEAVARSIEAALTYLSRIQDIGGGYAVRGELNLESTAQVVVALCTLGIDPDTDSRFQKSGGDPVEALLRFRCENGGFSHIPGESADPVASEQGLYALAALWRFSSGRSTLYDMSDADAQTEGVQKAVAPMAERETVRIACWLVWLL